MTRHQLRRDRTSPQKQRSRREDRVAQLCPECDGYGTVVGDRHRGGQLEDCPTCGGAGVLL